MNKFKLIKDCTQIAIGIIMLVTALVTYWGNFQYGYELTFFSSMLSGLFFIIAGVLELVDIELHPILYLCDCILLFTVFGVCMAFASHYPFAGGFAFLHIINPLLVTAFFFVFIDTTKLKLYQPVFVSAFPLAYLVFVFIFGSMTDNYIYFFMDYKEIGIGYTLTYIAVLLVLIIAFGYIFHFLNKLLRQHFPLSPKIQE